VGVAEMVRLGVEELGVEEFKRRSGCFPAVAETVVQQEGAGGKAAQVVENELKVKSEELKGLEGGNSVLTFNSQLLTENQELVRQLLTCAYQGTVNSSDDTFNSAKELADSIGARFHNWEIDEEVAGYVDKIQNALQRELTWKTDDLALQNIQARVRAPAIWLLANVQNALLITTSNRSEASVGYCTMDGDTAGSISPIAGVDKDFVKKWLRWAETELGYPALRHVNALQPTAELRPLEEKQTDERDLMPYALLNRIERLAFYDRLSPSKVLAALETEETGFDREQLKTYVRRFYNLWSRNQWKRERYAPSFHLDDYNVDPRSWLRFPILSGGFAAELAGL
jgi:NAD+ synthase (glutamine-hydrolysing)